MELEAVKNQPNDTQAPIKDTLDVKDISDVTPMETSDCDINKEGGIEALTDHIANEDQEPLNNGTATETADEEIIDVKSESGTTVSEKMTAWSQCTDTSLGSILVISSQEEATSLGGEKSGEIDLHVSSDFDQTIIASDPNANSQEEINIESTLIEVAAEQEEENAETVSFIDIYHRN